VRSVVLRARSLPFADLNVLKSVQFAMKDGAVFKAPPNAAPAA